MASDSFIKDQLSKVKSILNPLSFRQTGSLTNQGDGLQSIAKQTHALRANSRSSTALLPVGSYDHGYTTSPEDTSVPTQPRTINVVLFGETGVGKSSVINLIAQKEVARVSSDVNGCTMQSTRYDIPFDDMNFAIFDTIGLEEPQMGVNGYLKAIEKAYELIVKLGAAGGIHLLLFCMRGGRITATTQSNYRLFCECLCNTKVPIALVFTGLERELEMEDWWTRNKTHIEHYGIKSDGHACITAVQDETPEERFKYVQSQTRIRELLKTCALKNEAFLPEPHSWFAKLGKGMRSFIEKHRNPKRRDVMRVLTHRCKLDPETARKIAEMMEKGDPETKEDEVNKEESNSAVGTSEVTKDAAEPDALSSQLGDIKVAGSPDVRLDKKEAARELDDQSQHHDDIRTVPRDRDNALEGQGNREVAKKDAGDPDPLSKQRGAINPVPRNRDEGKDEGVKRDAGKLDVASRQPGEIRAVPRDREHVPEKDPVKKHTDVPSKQHSEIKARGRDDVLVAGRDKRAGEIVTKKPGTPSKQYGDMRAGPPSRTDAPDSRRTRMNEDQLPHTQARPYQDWQVIEPVLN